MSVKLSVERLKELCDPYEMAWGCGRIYETEVQQAIWGRRFRYEPFSLLSESEKSDKLYHVKRIAYFVEHGWNDPISIDVGVPGLSEPEWLIEDGNHRLAAAIYLRDKEILAEVSGSLEHAKMLFGVDCEEKENV